MWTRTGPSDSGFTKWLPATSNEEALPIFTNTKDAAKGLSLTVIGILVVIALAIGIGLVGIFGFGWLSNTTADYRGNVAVHNQVNANGSYRIAAYDHFFNLCQQVQSDETSIQNDQDQLKVTKDPQQAVVLNSAITALKNQRADAILQYNVDSEKGYTEGQFKSSNLPYRLYLTTKETTCHA